MMNRLIAPLVALRRPQKRLIQIGADLMLITVCFGLAMLLRLESLHFLSEPRIWLALGLSAAATVATFWALGLYRAVVRFVSGEVIRVLLTGVAVSALALYLARPGLGAPIPPSVPAIHAALLLLAAGGVRFLVRRMFREAVRRKGTPVLIYGAGEGGRQLLSGLRHGHEYAPVGFLDDDVALQGRMIAGCPVHAPAQAAQLIRQHDVRAILLAIPSLSRARRREIMAQLEGLGVEVKTMPGIADLVSGRATVSELRRVLPEDLLGRDPVPPRADLMTRNIDGKVVLVTGAGGSIGSELCRQIVTLRPAALILLDVSEAALFTIHTELNDMLARSRTQLRIEPVLGSVQNPGRMRSMLRGFGVQTVYHAAAYKHVGLVEANIVEGIRNNVFGTRVLAEAAADMGVESFILVSTDKAVRPTNVMGASKRLAELVCQAQARRGGRTCFSMVRFGNVLGSSGSVIPRFREQIERGGPVTVMHRDVIRYFMTIPEAAQLVIQAGAMAQGGEVFVLDMGEPVRILDLAQTMIRLHGLVPYVLEDGAEPDPRRGDIPIRITRLGPGEKLYEELLIGEDPQPTAHERILAARELSLEPAELDALLERLHAACLAFDIPQVQRLLREAPLGYRPEHAGRRKPGGPGASLRRPEGGLSAGGSHGQAGPAGRAGRRHGAGC
jgi:FlaA1/EpsC-like NDP-sugar epimerase